MRKKLIDAIWMLSMLLAIVFIIAFGVWGVAILFLQGVVWFKSGSWTSIPARAAFYYTKGDYPPLMDKALPSSFGDSDFSQWLQFPQSALGPHQLIMYLLENTSLWLFFLLTALAILIAWALIHSEFAQWSEAMAKQGVGSRE